ncbi:hypothetical protein EDC32_1011 [Laceyella sacchari]|nr:hypothetical protein EDC32_1011 [Laceyella sacchari]
MDHLLSKELFLEQIDHFLGSRDTHSLVFREYD